MVEKIQLRGNCPACGAHQAVTRGWMAKHGYQVKHGYFQGICKGSNEKPMQESRVFTESWVVTIRIWADDHDVKALKLESGKIHPTTVPHMWYGHPDKTWEEATIHEREKHIANLVRTERGHADYLRRHAEVLLGLLDNVYGKPLEEVKKPVPPAPIYNGEQRKYEKGEVLTVTRVDGARVYYKTERGFKGRIGTQAWRRLALVTPVDNS